MKKAIIISLLSVALVVLLALVIFTTFISLNPKEEIHDYVLENRVELNDYVIRLLSEKADDYHGEFDTMTVDLWKGCNMVEFSKTRWGFGIVPASTYRGFYYSPENVPIGFQGAALEFRPVENGWESKPYPGSSIREYTERIADNWFFYEVKF